MLDSTIPGMGLVIFTLAIIIWTIIRRVRWPLQSFGLIFEQASVSAASIPEAVCNIIRMEQYPILFARPASLMRTHRSQKKKRHAGSGGTQKNKLTWYNNITPINQGIIMPIYRVPFSYPSPDLVPTALLRDLLQVHNVTIGFDFNAPHDSVTFHTITGELDNLAFFMMDIMAEVTREWFDAGEWRRNVKENYEWNPDGLGPGTGCYARKEAI
mgnify:CR=1 FL=1